MLRIVLRSVDPVHGGSKVATNRLIHLECGFETNPGRKRCPMLPKKWLPCCLPVSETKNMFFLTFVFMCLKRCSEPKNTSRDGILCAQKFIFRFIVRFWNKFWPETMAIFTLGAWEKCLEPCFEALLLSTVGVRLRRTD